MNGAKIIALGLASVLLTASGCVTGRGDLTNSAESLDHDAYSLARTTSDENTSDRYARDVQALSEDAHSFRRATEDRRASDEDLRAAFKQVSRSYLLVRDDVQRSDSSAAREDLGPVTRDYLNVERDFGGYPAEPERP